jgi:hypothetical protein
MILNTALFLVVKIRLHVSAANSSHYKAVINIVSLVSVMCRLMMDTFSRGKMHSSCLFTSKNVCCVGG